MSAASSAVSVSSIPAVAAIGDTGEHRVWEALAPEALGALPLRTGKTAGCLPVFFSSLPSRERPLGFPLAVPDVQMVPSLRGGMKGLPPERGGWRLRQTAMDGHGSP